MRLGTASALVVGSICLLRGAAAAEDAVRLPVRRVEVVDRAFRVNGRKLIPIMAWLQDPKNFPAMKACGMNTVAGYWPRSGGTRDVKEYLDLVEKAGLLGVMPFDKALEGHEALRGHPALLGYIHDDEPDLPRRVSDAVVEPAKGLKINRRTPLWKLLDGDLTSWSVLDPLDGAAVTFSRPRAPTARSSVPARWRPAASEAVTVTRVAVAMTVSKGLSLAKEVSFEAGGKEILRVALAARKGRQTFDLARPATFEALTMRVRAVTPGKNVWGSFGEIEAFDADGKNVLLSPPRTVPRQTPAETMRRYAEIRALDPSRPVFMTLTGYFHPQFKKWSDEERAMYPRYVRAADVVGYDIYPIYGWNKPEWIHLVHEATGLLARMAAPRPVYAWIETSKGGQHTGPLAGQKEVTPRHIRAEVWMAVCRGATAIGYFTHVWKPRYSQFGVPEENRAALARTNAQLTRLAPAILGTEPGYAAGIEAEGGVKVDLLAREHGGELHLFAVNYDERLKEAQATIRIEGLPAGTEVVVVDEDRTIRAEAGHFADTFAPLAVHIYRLSM